MMRHRVDDLRATKDAPAVPMARNCPSTGLRRRRPHRSVRLFKRVYEKDMMGSSVPLRYDENQFIRRLSSIAPTVESIQSLSYFMLFLECPFGRSLVEHWREVFLRSDREHRVHLLYLANDVLQNARLRLDDDTAVRRLSRTFLDALVPCLAEMGRDERFERLLEVWKERQVFTSDELSRLTTHLNWQVESRERVRDVEPLLADVVNRLTSTATNESDERYLQLVELSNAAHQAAVVYLANRDGSDS